MVGTMAIMNMTPGFRGKFTPSPSSSFFNQKPAPIGVSVEIYEKSNPQSSMQFAAVAGDISLEGSSSEWSRK